MKLNRQVEIHSWGGLGSQLFAFAFLFDLEKLFPNRTFILVHHTSGETKRFLDTKFAQSFNVRTRIVDDFETRSHPSSRNSISSLVLHIMKNTLKVLLKQLGVVVYPDSKTKVRVWPWTMQIRGHYYRRKLSHSSLQLIFSYFLKSSSNPKLSNCLLIHYRHGDLVNIESKLPISVDRIISVIENFNSSHEFESIVICSDSPVNEIPRFEILLESSRIPRSSFEYRDFSVDELIRYASGTAFFLGTNSKISLWIAILRHSLGHSSTSTYLPKEFSGDWTKLGFNLSSIAIY